jgi:hypothetical protein
MDCEIWAGEKSLDNFCNYWIWFKLMLQVPVTVAVRSKAGIVGSNPLQGMDG